MNDERMVVGCMTGTSIDGIDAALVRVTGRGLHMRATLVGGMSRALGVGGGLSRGLRDLAEQRAMTAGAIADLARAFSLAHAEVVRELIGQHGGRADLVCVHGQTVYHKPPVSWQMFNPWPLARAVGVPVVFDLRGADIAAGGQGAPMTPIADWVLFRAAKSRAVVNLGGFCNVTLLPGEQEISGASEQLAAIGGFDVCACNLLLDEIARRLLGKAFDEDGAAARAGSVHAEALEHLGGVLASQGRSGRSLGTGDEVTEWVSRWRAHMSPGDLAATACEGVGRTIGQRVQGAGEILLAGGGARNGALVDSIVKWASGKVLRLDEVGVGIDMREAAEMAVLGALCQDGVAITLPRVTGVASPAPIAGCWVFPDGRGPG